MSYSKLSEHFKARTPFKYNKEVHFDGTKIIATEVRWTRDQNGRWFRQKLNDQIVLAEYVQHNGKEYAVVYNRGNKCFATEVMMWGFNIEVTPLQTSNMARLVNLLKTNNVPIVAK